MFNVSLLFQLHTSGLELSVNKAACSKNKSGFLMAIEKKKCLLLFVSFYLLTMFDVYSYTDFWGTFSGVCQGLVYLKDSGFSNCDSAIKSRISSYRF